MIVYGAMRLLSVLRKKSSLKYFLKEAASTLTGSFSKDLGEWWDSANVNKNNGFYVGMCDGKFVGPTTTFEFNTFERSRVIVKMFIDTFSAIEDLRESDYKSIPLRQKQTD